MKSAYLFIFIFILACGRVELKVGDKLGDFKNVSPLTLGGQELELLKSICNSISQKTSALPVLVNSSLTFSYSSRSCEDESYSLPVDVLTTIQNSFNGYRFLKSDGTSFYFSDPETTDSGTMSLFCKQLNETQSLQSPLQAGQEYAFISTTGISSEDCATSVNEVCVEISKGSLDLSGLAKIHTKEWIKFSLDTLNGRKGFFTSKKLISSIGCPEGKLIGHKANLK
jgi:hypothetical protein